MSEKQTVAGAYAKIEAHEYLCAERYANIHSAIADIKALAKWALGLIMAVLVSVTGWSLVQIHNANNARLDALEAPAAVHSGVR